MTTLRPELLDERPADYERPEGLWGDDGLVRQLVKAAGAGTGRGAERAPGLREGRSVRLWQRPHTVSCAR